MGLKHVKKSGLVRRAMQEEEEGQLTLRACVVWAKIGYPARNPYIRARESTRQQRKTKKKC